MASSLPHCLRRASLPRPSRAAQPSATSHKRRRHLVREFSQNTLPDWSVPLIQSLVATNHTSMSALFSTGSHCGLRPIVRPPPPYTARFPGAFTEERSFSRAAAAAAAARAELLSASSAAALAPVTRARVASYKARDDAAAAAAVAALRSATRPAATASFDGASLRFLRAGCAQRDHGEDGHGSLTTRKDVP